MRAINEFIKGHFEGRKNLIVAELGVWRGENALEIYNNIHPEKLYLVDSYSPDVWGWKKEYDGNEKEAHDRMSDEETRDRLDVVWMKMTMTAASEVVKDDFDFVYIDGDHHRNSLLQDICNWFPKVKIGGVIAGHDIEFGHIKDCVERMFPDKYKVAESDWWYIKETEHFPGWEA